VAREYKSLSAHMQAGGKKLHRVEQIPQDTPNNIAGGLEALLGFFYLRIGTARIAQQQGEVERAQIVSRKAGRDQEKELELLEKAIPALRKIRARKAEEAAALGLVEGEEKGDDEGGEEEGE